MTPESRGSRLNGHRIVATLADGSVAIECAFCEGQATYPPSWNEEDDPPTVPCSVCRGAAFNVIPASVDATQLCRLCSGSGKEFDSERLFNGDTCRVCSGTGVVDVGAVARARVRPGPNWSSLHQEVVSISRTRFESGQYADAVEAAFKQFNHRVKQAAAPSVDASLDGSALMTRVFSPNTPILRLAEASSPSAQSIQQGYMQIFAGAMTGIRNPKAHENISISPERALHFLYLASLCFHKLDEALALRDDTA